jgi:hypothetical protein
LPFITLSPPLSPPLVHSIVRRLKESVVNWWVRAPQLTVVALMLKVKGDEHFTSFGSS